LESCDPEVETGGIARTVATADISFEGKEAFLGRACAPDVQAPGFAAYGGSMSKIFGLAVALSLAAALIGAPPQSRYQLKSGDTLDLSFTYVPEFNQTVTIQPDGYVSLRGAGDLRAGGITLPELKKAIDAKYTGILKEPDVSVEIKDFEKPFFLAQGEVGKPGKYDLRSDIKLSEAVAIAGGLNPNAKHSQVLLFRRQAGDTVVVKEIDLKRVLSGKDLATDVRIQAGDMVVVPKSRISKVKEYANMVYGHFPLF
jgi:polysaccharide biosynthesis/export protein